MALTKEQEAGHNSCITGTDAAAIVGLSPHKTFADVWVEKKHPELCQGPDEKKAQMFYFGNQHEVTIKEEYEKRQGVKLIKPCFMVHPKATWLGGSPDFLVTDKPLGVEAKTAEVWGKSDWGNQFSADIPVYYFIQCQHYMMLTGFKEWHCAAFIGLYTFNIYQLFEDPELQSMLLTAEKTFYERYIAGRETPEFDTGEQVRSYVQKRYPKHVDKKKYEVNPYGDKELKSVLLKLREARIARSRIAKEYELQKTLVMAYMKDAEQLNWTEQEMLIYYRNNKPSSKIKWMEIAQEAMKGMPVEKRKALMEQYTEAKPGARPMKIYDKGAEVDDD